MLEEARYPISAKKADLTSDGRSSASLSGMIANAAGSRYQLWKADPMLTGVGCSAGELAASMIGALQKTSN